MTQFRIQVAMQQGMTLFQAERLLEAQRVFQEILAAVFEKDAQYNKAFDCLAAGNKLKRAGFTCSLREDEASWRQIKGGFNPAFFKKDVNAVPRIKRQSLSLACLALAPCLRSRFLPVIIRFMAREN